jgi:NAD(P)-dependent dehydrogenase (short-subunit alcohol dehydrogenase family)
VYGTFLLTYLLLPLMMQTEHARVINLVSGLMLRVKTNEPLATMEDCKRAGLKQMYETSKRLEQIMTMAFSQHFLLVEFRSLCPGFVPTTGLARSRSLLMRAFMQVLQFAPFADTLDYSIACIDMAIADTDTTNNGQYLYRKQWGQLSDVTPEQVDAMWEKCRQITQV